jgi:hypothetical protein
MSSNYAVGDPTSAWNTLGCPLQEFRYRLEIQNISVKVLIIEQASSITACIQWLSVSQALGSLRLLVGNMYLFNCGNCLKVFLSNRPEKQVFAGYGPVRHDCRGCSPERKSSETVKQNAILVYI